MPGLRSATIGVFISAGGRHERLEQNGIAHFLEHMAFKGTPTRTARAIAEEIEDVGGYINAYTGKEMTAYYARVLEADVERALGILADIVLEPALRDARHRGGARGDPAGDRPGARHARRHHLRLAAGGRLSGAAVRADHPRAGGAGAGLRPAGPRGLRRRALRAGPDDPVGGGRRRSGRAAGSWPSGISAISSRRSALPVLPARFAGGERREARDLEQVHMAMAFESPGVRDDAAYAAQIYATALGGGMSSRLFQELRERRGLCYTHLRPGRRLRGHRAHHALRRHRAGADPRADRARPSTSCAAPPTA